MIRCIRSLRAIIFAKSSRGAVVLIRIAFFYRSITLGILWLPKALPDRIW